MEKNYLLNYGIYVKILLRLGQNIQFMEKVGLED